MFLRTCHLVIKLDEWIKQLEELNDGKVCIINDHDIDKRKNLLLGNF
jgi:hypothetical protein